MSPAAAMTPPPDGRGPGVGAGEADGVGVAVDVGVGGAATGVAVGVAVGELAIAVSTTRRGRTLEAASLLSKPNHAVEVVVSARPTVPAALTSEDASHDT